MRIHWIFLSSILAGCASLDSSFLSTMESRVPKTLAYQAPHLVPAPVWPQKVSMSARPRKAVKVPPKTLPLILPRWNPGDSAKNVKPEVPTGNPKKGGAEGPDIPRLSLPSRLVGQKSPLAFAKIIMPTKPEKKPGTSLRATGVAANPVTSPGPGPTAGPNPGKTSLLAPASSPIPETSVVQKELNSEVGSDLLLQFNKLNWTLLGTSEEFKKAGFVEKRAEKDRTTFLFRPKTPLEMDLVFERQDLTSTGGKEIIKYRWKVSDLKPSLGVPGAAQESGVKDTGTANLSLQEALEVGAGLERLGRLDEAWTHYQTYLTLDSPQINHRLALLAQKKGSWLEAKKYWDRNLTFNDPEILQGALSGLTDLRLSSKIPGGAKNLGSLWKEKKLTPPEPQYLKMVDQLQAEGQDVEALDLSQTYQSLFGGQGQFPDRVLLLQARILEKPGAQRNIRESYKLYQQILDEYPLSPHRKEAQERLNFLTRNYFQLR